MVRRRNLVGNDCYRLRKQMSRLIRAFPRQPREEMALDVQLIPHRRLALDGGFVIRDGLLHREFIVQSQLETGLRQLLQITADTDNSFYNTELLVERLPAEIRS